MYKEESIVRTYKNIESGYIKRLSDVFKEISRLKGGI